MWGLGNRTFISREEERDKNGNLLFFTFDNHNEITSSHTMVLFYAQHNRVGRDCLVVMVLGGKV